MTKREARVGMKVRQKNPKEPYIGVGRKTGKIIDILVDHPFPLVVKVPRTSVFQNHTWLFCGRELERVEG